MGRAAVRAGAHRDGQRHHDAHPDRSPNPHVAFGHGVHHCLGAQLARLVLQVALGVLLRRLPRLRVAVDEGEIVWKTGMEVRGPKSLPVQW
ncbi:cytochrome P450 [Streptomyces asiaticus]|uniref:cytochrome P450 n=1 Tax=Streptomyces asiaticus TaxID=114695 RepID=UPI003D73273E